MSVIVQHRNRVRISTSDLINGLRCVLTAAQHNFGWPCCCDVMTMEVPCRAQYVLCVPTQWAEVYNMWQVQRIRAPDSSRGGDASHSTASVTLWLNGSSDCLLIHMSDATCYGITFTALRKCDFLYFVFYCTSALW